jgi:putative Holliday junction resolvase
VAAGRMLCLDVGERRIGVAVSDPSGRLATPLTIVERRAAERDFRRIADLVRDEGAERVVVGLPHTLAGEIGPQARRIQRWADRLVPYLSVPLVFADERYSTAEASRRLAGAGLAERGDKPDGRRRARAANPGGGVSLDAAAAAVILQDYLDETA